MHALSYRAELNGTKGLEFQVGRVGGDGQDAEGVGVAKTSFPTLHSNDGRTGCDDLEGQRVTETETDAVVNINLPLVKLHPTWFGIPERIAAAMQMDLPCSLLVASDCEINK